MDHPFLDTPMVAEPAPPNEGPRAPLRRPIDPTSASSWGQVGPSALAIGQLVAEDDWADRAELRLIRRPIRADTGGVDVAMDDVTDRTVQALVSEGLFEVEAGATIREVAEQLASEDVGALVVVDEGRIHGLVSERDVVGAVAAGRDIDALRAADLDTRELVTCNPDTAILDAATLMMEHYVRHLVVGDQGRPIGVISARDLLGALAI